MASTSSRPKLKTAWVCLRMNCRAWADRSFRFKKSRVIAPLYTGGPVAVTPDGTRLVTVVGEEAVLTDVREGREICRFAGVRVLPQYMRLIIFNYS